MIDEVIRKLYQDDFERFDLCAKGFQLEFGPYKVEIVPIIVYNVALGPVPCVFQ